MSEDEDEDEGGVENDSIISSENFAGVDDMDYGDEELDGRPIRRRRHPIPDVSDDENGDVEDLDADDEEDGSGNGDGEDPEDDEDGLETQDSVQNMVPIEFAKAHIAKIEDDMKHMHERHVKLMREMDSNYKMIEKET